MKQKHLTPADSLCQFLSQRPSGRNTRIPLSAYFGAAAFVAALFLMMHVGHIVGF